MDEYATQVTSVLDFRVSNAQHHSYRGISLFYDLFV